MRVVKGPRKYLEQKRRVWWFKRAIPEECRGAFGGLTTYRQSLQTSDLRVAMERRDILFGEVSRLIAEARAGRAPMDPRTIAAHRGQLWRETLRDLQEGDDEEALETAEQAEEDERERLKGPARRAFEHARLGRVPVDHYLEAFLSAARELAEKTKNERRGLVRRFAAWAAAEKLTLDRIGRKEVGRYVGEVIDPMDPATARKHLTALRQYWVFLHARGHVEGDDKGGPWVGQKVKARGRRVTRAQGATERPFTEEEVKALLFSPWPERLDRSHRDQLHDALRISLLSGMRMDEALSLWVEDVEDGHFVIREGKTAAAARGVPIHPDLADIVTRRVAGKQATDWLFHELRHERDPGDVFTKRFRRYRLKVGVDDKREGKRRSLVNFHSARRWFITQARYAGQPRETIGDVVGHRPDKKDETFGTYTPGASAEQRRACVESVRLPSV